MQLDAYELFEVYTDTLPRCAGVLPEVGDDNLDLDWWETHMSGANRRHDYLCYVKEDCLYIRISPYTRSVECSIIAAMMRVLKGIDAGNVGPWLGSYQESQTSV